jgi:hypothetical protein
VILRLALETITGQPLNVALRRMVLRLLGLRNTVASQSAAVPQPVLHAYSGERRAFLGIPPSTPFLEDSTFWNPSWTLPRGAVGTTDIADMTRTAIGIGSGRLLTRRHTARRSTRVSDSVVPQPGCGRCRTLNRLYGYRLGVVRNGAWILRTRGSAVTRPSSRTCRHSASRSPSRSPSARAALTPKATTARTGLRSTAASAPGSPRVIRR